MSRLTDALPSELIFRIAEDICWDLETGWDSARLVPFSRTCRYIYTSVRPLIRSSIKRWDVILKAPHSPWIRSILINVRQHECGPECAMEGSKCPVPFIVRSNTTLVHLELIRCEYPFLRALATRVKGVGFPNLRYLSMTGDLAFVSSRAMIGFTSLCPNLENLVAMSLTPEWINLRRHSAAPFHLRRLHVDAGELDYPIFAWLSGTYRPRKDSPTVPTTLDHLALGMFECNTLEDMDWLPHAKDFLATLPRLSAFEHTAAGLKCLLGFTPALVHLRAQINQLPPFDVLPKGLVTLQLDKDSASVESVMFLSLRTLIEVTVRLRATEFTASIQLMWNPELCREVEDLRKECERVRIPLLVDGSGAPTVFDRWKSLIADGIAV
ncbi:hypothetical protein EXIGLDRAFT_58986 [Exidia glandulosa HHB12029]|uniref:F-box domain-containing protein n=1 Tax=Exidia glandulosa HHB12029 TaxID=1314781 RepID=A0A165I550_EXIGL|nr:hypothetical protein EXIGLDRAFT_58986 [Exidia glandulosa HHB12029]